MSERNMCVQAIILTAASQGENNRSICALSADMGLFYATLYGGPKNKLRSLVQPFNMGNLWIYRDKARQSVKITDFEVIDSHINLHTNLYKIWAANLACEILLKTHCAGDAKSAFALFNAFIKGLDVTGEKESILGTIRFLWRYLAILGVQPSIEECSQCGCNFKDNNFCYIPSSSCIICTDCAGTLTAEDYERQTYFPLRRSSISYLNSINTISPGKVRSLVIDSQTVYELKKFIFFLTEQAVGKKLKCIETGMGIL